MASVATLSLGLRFLGREEVSLWQAAMLFYLQQLPLPRCVFKYFCKSHILCFAPSKNSEQKAWTAAVFQLGTQ